MTKKKKNKSSATTKKTRKNKQASSSRSSKKQQKSRKPAAPKIKVKSKAVKTAAGKKIVKKRAFLGKKLQDIRKKLLKQKELLLVEAGAALNSLPGQIVFPDMGDQATAETDRNFMLRLRSREQKLIKKIDDALDRIENGTFGICEDCGMEINIQRLEARPVTTLCIECKTQQEEEERMRE